jgi:membrane protease YdiL (CAAX protease family)
MPPFPQSFHEDSSNTGASRSKSPLKFFLLVFAFSIPFWLIGSVTGLQLLSDLPVSALMFVCPMMAASTLVYRENKSAGVIELLKRSFDCKRIKAKVWYAPIILIMPCATVLTYGLMRLMGLPLSTTQFPVLAAVAMFFVFFVAALCEELGWSGYVIDPMQARWSALGASIVVGLVWAAWHCVPLMQAHRSLAWIGWWSLTTVASRVLIVWLYNNTRRSVFAAALFHAFTNVSGIIFSNYYDPRIIGPILAFAAAIVTVVWGASFRGINLHGIGLLISPLLAGLVMSLIGSLRRRRGMSVIRLDSFGYGFIFAFGMGLIRFLFTK